MIRTARFYYDDGRVVDIGIGNDAAERFVRIPPASDDPSIMVHCFRLRDREVRDPLVIQYDEVIWG